MKRYSITFIFIVLIGIIGSSASADLLRYSIDGSLNLMSIYTTPNNSDIHTSIYGTAYLSDEAIFYDNYQVAVFDIIHYEISIVADPDLSGNPDWFGDYYFTGSGSVTFNYADVYIDMGGGTFSSCFLGPEGDVDYEIPIEFWGDAYGSWDLTMPTEWINGMDCRIRTDSGSAGIGFSYAPIPEPATMLLLGFGLFGFAWFRKKFSV